MLRSLKDLEHYTVTATDGVVGSVVGFLLDDESWAIRYLVVDRIHSAGPRVLVTPISFRKADSSTRTFHLDLTREKVENSPSIDTDEPVSRQHERDLFGYYGYPYYWGNPGLWGAGIYPGLLAKTDRPHAPIEATSKHADDVHLRSTNELRGYHIQGTDAAVGHLDDLVVDDETWKVRYLVIDTSNWWVGRRVLVAPAWARTISWEQRKIRVDLTRQAIKGSPEWDPLAPVNREYESRLYDYYGRPEYWGNGDGQVTAPVPMHAPPTLVRTKAPSKRA